VNIKSLVLELYKLAANEMRKLVTEPLHPDLWKVVNYKNPQYLAQKRMEWLQKENAAAIRHQFFEATFWGRMGERLPGWAARLAICDNPQQPFITNEHIDIAQTSLIAELRSCELQQESGELDSEVNQCAKYIVDLFRGDMTKNKSLNSGKNKHILIDGACELHRIMGKVRPRAAYKTASLRFPNIDQILLATIKTRGLIEVPKDESINKYKYRGRVLRRV
ncbi:MAG: hypothetical protein R3250_04415, partial [Melioribacteraceae bacterium]|nr:hypothetical protein [Melioribacteraceae bacterium]